MRSLPTARSKTGKRAAPNLSINTRIPQTTRVPFKKMNSAPVTKKELGEESSRAGLRRSDALLSNNWRVTMGKPGRPQPSSNEALGLEGSKPLEGNISFSSRGSSRDHSRISILQPIPYEKGEPNEMSKGTSGRKAMEGCNPSNSATADYHLNGVYNDQKIGESSTKTSVPTGISMTYDPNKGSPYGILRHSLVQVSNDNHQQSYGKGYFDMFELFGLDGRDVEIQNYFRNSIYSPCQTALLYRLNVEQKIYGTSISPPESSHSVSPPLSQAKARASDVCSSIPHLDNGRSFGRTTNKPLLPTSPTGAIPRVGDAVPTEETKAGVGQGDDEDRRFNAMLMKLQQPPDVRFRKKLEAWVDPVTNRATPAGTRVEKNEQLKRYAVYFKQAYKECFPDGGDWKEAFIESGAVPLTTRRQSGSDKLSSKRSHPAGQDVRNAEVGKKTSERASSDLNPRAREFLSLKQNDTEFEDAKGPSTTWGAAPATGGESITHDSHMANLEYRSPLSGHTLPNMFPASLAENQPVGLENAASAFGLSATFPQPASGPNMAQQSAGTNYPAAIGASFGMNPLPMAGGLGNSSQPGQFSTNSVPHGGMGTLFGGLNVGIIAPAARIYGHQPSFNPMAPVFQSQLPVMSSVPMAPKPPGPCRKPKEPDTKSQIEYEQWIEWRRTYEPGYALKCRARQAQRALRSTTSSGHAGVASSR